MEKEIGGGIESIFGKVIYSYTRAEAIEDGVLVDVTSAAVEVGLRFPVAATRSVYEKCIAVPVGLDGILEESGRARDVMWLLRCEIQRSLSRSSTLFFSMQAVTAAPNTREIVELKAMCGPGDNGAPVITIMLPHED